MTTSRITAKRAVLLALSVLLSTVVTACNCNLRPTPSGVHTEEPAQAPMEQPTPVGLPTTLSLGDTWVRPTDGMVMVYVPSGTFQMGSAIGDLYTASNEYPQHTVTLDGFWLDRTEVSVAQFRQFVTKTGYVTEAEQEGWALAWTGTEWDEVEGVNWQHPYGSDSSTPDDHPVVQVTWDDAVAYCEWAGVQLPTEAQWEYAARGSEGFIYPWRERQRLRFS